MIRLIIRQEQHEEYPHHMCLKLGHTADWLIE